MTTRPHDATDLYLAPVALHLDGELERLANLSEHELQVEIAMATNREAKSVEDRRVRLLEALTHLQDLHSWEVSWCERGLRIAHAGNAIVLGIPPGVRAYLGI